MREDEDEGAYEIPVDDLMVDVRNLEIRLADGERWALEGDLDQGLIPEDSVRGLPLAKVAEALGLLSEHVQDGAPEGWFLETDPPNRLCDIELHEGLALESYGTDQLYATVSIGVPVDADEHFENTVEQLVAPMLRHAGAVGRKSRVSQLFEHEVAVMVRFQAMTGRTVGDLISLGDDVRALLLAVRSGEPDEDVALNLVLAGHAAALVGQPESRWLDAKKQLWELGTRSGSAEAAKDLSCDCDQELLLPPSSREWLPQGHLAWFVVDAVEQLDLSEFCADFRDDGWGRAAHDPVARVALLLSAYAVGERSSRQTERRCLEDVAFRVLPVSR